MQAVRRLVRRRVALPNDAPVSHPPRGERWWRRSRRPACRAAEQDARAGAGPAAAARRRGSDGERPRRARHRHRKAGSRQTVGACGQHALKEGGRVCVASVRGRFKRWRVSLRSGSTSGLDACTGMDAGAGAHAVIAAAQDKSRPAPPRPLRPKAQKHQRVQLRETPSRVTSAGPTAVRLEALKRVPTPTSSDPRGVPRQGDAVGGRGVVFSEATNDRVRALTSRSSRACDGRGETTTATSSRSVA